MKGICVPHTIHARVVARKHILKAKLCLCLAALRGAGLAKLLAKPLAQLEQFGEMRGDFTRVALRERALFADWSKTQLRIPM